MLRDAFGDAGEVRERRDGGGILEAYQTTRGISAAIASSMPLAASGGLFLRSVFAFYDFRALNVRNENG